MAWAAEGPQGASLRGFPIAVAAAAAGCCLGAWTAGVPALCGGLWAPEAAPRTPVTSTPWIRSQAQPGVRASTADGAPRHRPQDRDIPLRSLRGAHTVDAAIQQVPRLGPGPWSWSCLGTLLLAGAGTALRANGRSASGAVDRRRRIAMFAAADTPAPPSAPDASAPGPEPSAAVPIASLSPGATGWRLRARVTRRTPTKEYKTPVGKGVGGGVGRRFIAEVADAAGGQIRCVFLGSAVDRYDGLVAEGRTYEIAGGIVRKADRRFSRIDCPYDIALDDRAEVVPIEDDAVAPPHPAATSLASLESHRKGLPVTVLGVVARRDAPAQVTTSRSPAGLPRREVVLADSTHRGVLLVLWGDAAVSFRHIVGDVVLVQNARVSDFRGTSLACSVRTVVTGDPDLPEAEALRRWWRSHEEPPKVHLPPTPPWPQRTIAELQPGDEAPAWAAKPFVLRCQVTGVRGGDPCYPACAVCRRKVIPTAPGGRWQCAKCATEDATMVPRFRLQMTVEDATGSREVTAFGGPAAVLLNHSAEEWAALSPADRSAALQSICAKPCVLRCVFGREAPAAGKGGGPAVLVQHIIEPAPPAPPTAPEP